jgi:hypothetical protein
MVAPPDYRRLESEMDWPFFDGGRSRLGADHHSVWPLTDEAGERLWMGLVGNPSEVFSPRELPPGHRLHQHTATGPNWYTFANDPVVTDQVVAFLQQALPWSDGQVAFYAHAPGRVYRASWVVFLRHWRLFTRQDESFVFGLGRPEWVLFADGGWLYVGGQARRT